MKRKKGNNSTRMTQWVAASALVILLSGCQITDQTNVDSNHNDNANVKDEQRDATKNGPQNTYLNDSTVVANAGNIKEQATESETDLEASSAKNGSTSLEKSKENDKPDSWNSELPKLHGISIGDSNETVVDQYGQEKDSYSLEEKSGKIHILEYDGFSVGFDDNGMVQFVEVYDSSIQPGLMDVKVGVKSEKALEQLGKPDKHTDYQLAYEGSGAMLKLDIDPKNNEVVSMKLFAVS
ncbi:hypothetical protein M6D81_12550 [Paenibacillus sp. J5C_2022]|uniref:hypothetical protein n=1 Tax=Paenibacillus sp. J5C2022 TaxID=2977129 RepID=UPI0021D32FA6|nr:hypothetical protein [Paenibacillus sp. J5C2022]MCU6709530.1 hypothetical protein [Paenibacillus sp. J5C2022]